MVRLLSGCIGTISALFLVAYISVYYRQWFTEPKALPNQIAFQITVSEELNGLVVRMLEE